MINSTLDQKVKRGYDTMATATKERDSTQEKEKADKRKELYEPSKFSSTLSINQIERHSHPESDQNLKEELSNTFTSFYQEKFKEGKSLDARVAAEEFMKILAEAHFGPDVWKKYNLENEEDKQHIFHELEQAFGVRFTDIRKSFQKGGYNTVDDFFRQHREPLLNSYSGFKRQKIASSLAEYIGDEEQRDELLSHLEGRAGHTLQKQYRATIDPQKAFQLISAYMSVPGAGEAIGKKPAETKATHIPYDIGGKPEVGKGVFADFETLEHKYQQHLKKLRKGSAGKEASAGNANPQYN